MRSPASSPRGAPASSCCASPGAWRSPSGSARSSRTPRWRSSPRTEALLYAAARAQLTEERLEPLLRDGTIVLLDRFVDSSLAYQGAGRALGIEQVRTVNLFATGELVPDRTLLLCISPAAGRARQRQRALEPDRLERESEDFFATIASAYDELARAEPGRIRVIDAAQPPEQVLRDALAALGDLSLPAAPSL